MPSITILQSNLAELEQKMSVYFSSTSIPSRKIVAWEMFTVKKKGKVYGPYGTYEYRKGDKICFQYLGNLNISLADYAKFKLMQKLYMQLKRQLSVSKKEKELF